MIEKYKVILINGRFLTQPITGVQRYAYGAISALLKLRELKERRYKFIIAIPDGNSKAYFLNNTDIEFFYDASSLPSPVWQQIRLPVVMKKLKADLLWSPCNIGPVCIRNHVVTIHDASIFAGPQWFSKRFRMYYRLILPIMGRVAKRVITDSNFSREELVKYRVCDDRKITVIPAGVNPEFTPDKSKILDFPYILTVGSRDPRKNVLQFVNAWQRLPIHIKGNRKLVIAGGGAKSFAAEIFKIIPNDVNFTGYINDKDLPSFYSGADAFVYPSLYEGFGLPPLEAMACGCPVVVSNVASLPEVCGDAAYYVDPYNVESIAEGMQKVLTDDTLRQNLIKKGLERAKLFSWEKAAKEHLKVFEEVSGNSQ